MLRRSAAVALSYSLLSLSSAQASDFRAAWVASVYNLNFPSRSGLPAEEQERQIAGIVEAAKKAGLNALMIQLPYDLLSAFTPILLRARPLS